MDTKIKPHRLLIGGLVAGLLFNIGGISAAVLFDVESAFRKVGWEPHPTMGFLHMGMRFLLGIVGVFVYAGLRPRFGAGPRTAVIAGLIIWFVGYLLPVILLVELGIFLMGSAALLTIWGLLEACIAITAGAWLYRE